MTGSDESKEKKKPNSGLTAKITVKIYKPYRIILEHFVEIGKYPSMSEAIRQALDKWIHEEMEKDERLRFRLNEIEKQAFALKNEKKEIHKEDEFFNELF